MNLRPWRASRDAAPAPPRRDRAGPLFAVLLGTCACFSHEVKTEPIEIKPIHITMDINLKVQRELDEFFSFEDQVDPDPSDDVEDRTNDASADRNPPSGEGARR